MKDNFYNELKNISGIEIIKNANLENDNTMRVKSKFLYKVLVFEFNSVRGLFKIIKKYNKKFYILGNGSNVLFSKEKYDDIIIKFMPKKHKEDYIVYSGSLVNYINSQYISKGIETFNFLSGVPCSVGGAIYMNAGAYGKEIKDIIEYVYLYDVLEDKYKVLSNDKCQFGYRKSIFQNNNYVILAAKIKLLYKDKKELLAQHHSYLNIRKNKMPLEFPNSGSIFKNPIEEKAGILIDKAGMKGFEIKGAKVSEKHANVIVNFNNAKGEDIIELIRIIKQKILENYKIFLEEEIIIFK